MAKKSLITAAFTNGTLSITVDGAGVINLPLSELTDELRERALIHGLTQKISDAAAIAKSELPDDPIAAARVKFEAMSSVAQRLIDGDWSKRSGDGSAPVAGIIYRAFAEYVANVAKAKKQPVPEDSAIRALYDKRDRADQLALRNIPEVATIIERMKAERGSNAATVNTADLLGELGL